MVLHKLQKSIKNNCSDELEFICINSVKSPFRKQIIFWFHKSLASLKFLNVRFYLKV